MRDVTPSLVTMAAEAQVTAVTTAPMRAIYRANGQYETLTTPQPLGPTAWGFFFVLVVAGIWW